MQFHPGWGRSPGEGHGNPLQYSCLENPMDRGAWRATVHGVVESQTRSNQLSTHACMVSHIGGIPQYSQLRQPGMLAPSSTFCSIQALSGLGDVHPHWGGMFAWTG